MKTNEMVSFHMHFSLFPNTCNLVGELIIIKISLLHRALHLFKAWDWMYYINSTTQEAEAGGNLSLRTS